MRLLSFLRSRLTYANVVASVALFVALGGISYAAVTLPARSVGRAQLRDGAVTKRALSPGLKEAFADRGRAGPRGATGVSGPQGPQGLAGSPATALGLPLGGDLGGVLPDPVLRAGVVTSAKIADGAVTSAAIADGSVTGEDVAESSLGPVPRAVEADRLAGIASSEIVRGGGTLLRTRHDPFVWHTVPTGENHDFALSEIVPGPEHGLLVGIRCANASGYGTGVRVLLANWDAGDMQLVVDDGVSEPESTTADGGYAAYAPMFAEGTRRVVFQGVRATGEAFFVSVLAEHQGDRCRGAASGYITS